MNKRALYIEQKLDVSGHVEQAVAEIRAVIEAAPNVGPVLVTAFRVLSTLGELREVVDAAPTVEHDGG